MADGQESEPLTSAVESLNGYVIHGDSGDAKPSAKVF